jgi:hypothetical protein
MIRTLEEEDKQLVIIVKDGKKKKPKDGSSGTINPNFSFVF